MTGGFHLLISSSRYPTRTVRSLMRDLHTVIPHSHRMNRGKMSLEDLSEVARQLGARYVMLVARWKGIPGKLEFYRPQPRGLKLLPPIIYIRGVKLQRQYPTYWRKLRIRPRKLLIFKPPKDEEARLAEALSEFFASEGWTEPLEAEASQGTIYMEVSPQRLTFHSTLNGRLVEVGPSITIRHLVWRVEKPESQG
ncbi:MAG: hypothetical protein DRO52_00550 [Candidatus Hecatellales archaeon]|nr:MAG: hypothetical protein DRO52_00550 [Candidatus Hecatellales archaeon]